MMPSRVDSSVCVEGLPSVTSTSGFTSSIWRWMNGRQICVSCGVGVAVAGRPPRNHVGDVGLAAVEPDRRHHPVEQLAGAADERQALDVLVAPGRFADEHDPRLRIAVGEHQPRRGVLQRAALELLQQRAQRLQRRRGSRRLARRRRSRLPAAARFRCAELPASARRFPQQSGRRGLADRRGRDRGVGFGSADRPALPPARNRPRPPDKRPAIAED